MNSSIKKSSAIFIFIILVLFFNQNCYAELNQKEINNLEKSCNDNNAASCFDLGSYYSSIKKNGKDLMKEINFYKKSCEKGHSVGCYNVGSIYDNIYLHLDYPNLNWSKSKENTLFYYTQACDKGFSVGCTDLGNYYDGRDYFKSFEYYKKSCDLEDGQGSVGVGMLYMTGNGIRIDKIMGIKSYKKACFLEDSIGCLRLGAVYEIGDGTSIDVNLALETYGIACDLKNQSGCELYARLKEKNK